MLTRSSSLLAFICLVFCSYVFFLDQEFLLRPPYWDSVFGVFREAIWLVDHKWNYYDFVFLEPGYVAGGSRVYLYSLYPILISFLYYLLNDYSSIFLILHLLNMFFAIAIIYVSLEMMTFLNFTNMDKIIYLIIILSTPLFISQVLALNMEVATALCLLIAMFSDLKNEKKKTLFFLYLGFFIKPTISILGVSLFLSKFIEKKWYNNKTQIIELYSFLYLLPVILFFLIGLVAKEYFADGSAGTGFDVSILLNPEVLLKKFIYFENFTSEISFVIRIVCLSFFILFIATLASYIPPLFQVQKNNIREVTSDLSEKCALKCSAVVSVFFISCLFFVAPMQRYCVSILIPMYFVVFIILQQLKCYFKYILLVVILLFNLLNSRGDLYKKLNLYVDDNSGFIIETTVLVQDAIKRDLELASRIQSVYFNEKIVTSLPYSYILAEPRFGYVKAPNKLLDFKFLSQSPEEFHKQYNNDKIFILNANNVSMKMKKEDCLPKETFSIYGGHSVELSDLSSCNFPQSFR